MKILVSAGEVSGDQRAAEVISALKKRLNGDFKAFGLGGSRLASEGVEITHNLSDYAVMGFMEIIRSLGKFHKLEEELKALCSKEKPDCILLVDYPGFNMRLGRWAKKRGIPVVHYVAPQMWAWGAWRVRKLRKSTDILLTLFAFEEPFFKKSGVNAVFTGHPLKKLIPMQNEHGDALGLLPGSRAQEVKKLLPEMLKAFVLLREKGIIESALVAVSDHLEKDVYEEALNTRGVQLLNGTQKVLTGSKAALVCSGTATLEAALYGVPFVVCYKTGVLNYFLARSLVKGVERIALANIIAEVDVVPELIQRNATPAGMQGLLEPLFCDSISAEAARKKLELLRIALRNCDPAETAAKAIINFLVHHHES